MTLPNFLILGAAKAGTTSLYEYLKQHPQIFMPPLKEARFFAFENQTIDFAGPGDLDAHRAVVTTLREYENLFQGAGQAVAIGEASPVYLYDEKACARIHQYVPYAKLIVVLRNPAERAHSSYLMNVRDGRETESFVRALAMEGQRIRENWELTWHYTRVGFYYQQLRRYCQAFPAEQLHVILYEELEKAPLRVVQGMYAFLGADTAFQPDVWVKYNVSMAAPDLRHRIPRRALRSLPARRVKPFLPDGLQRGMEKIMEQRDKPRPPLALEVRRQLQDLFREDIVQLEQLIGRDLSAWLDA